MHAKFIENVEPFFISEGFQFVKSMESFTKKFHYGEYRFRIEKITSGLNINLHYGIRFNIVEKVLGQIYGVKVSKSSNTIFINCFNSLQNKDLASFFVQTEEEILKGFEKVTLVYQGYALPYYKKYTTIESLEKLIRENIDKDDKRGNLKYHNYVLDAAFTGLIAARLIGENKYLADKSYYYDFIKRNRNERTFNEFKEYVKKLDVINFDPARVSIKTTS